MCDLDRFSKIQSHIFLVHFDYPSFIGTAWHIDFFAHSLFNSVPAGLFRQISKQVSLVLQPMFQVSLHVCLI